MYIETVPNRNSPPAILLRESYRQDGRVCKRTLCNLSNWPVAHIEGLRGVLKGGTVIAADQAAFTVTRSLPHGHVAAVLGTARKIGLDRILGPDGNRCRDLVLAMIVGRIIIPSPSLPPHGGCHRIPPAPAWARNSASVPWTRTNSTPLWTRCASASPRSRRNLPGAICNMAHYLRKSDP